MIEYQMPETRQYRCYKIGDILFVPHYTISKMYAGPSKPKYFDEQELKRMNAKIVVEQLWSTPARNGE